MESQIRPLLFWTNEQELEDLERVLSKPRSHSISPYQKFGQHHHWEPKPLGNLHLGWRVSLAPYPLFDSRLVFSMQFKACFLCCRGFLKYVHQTIFMTLLLLFLISRPLISTIDRFCKEQG